MSLIDNIADKNFGLTYESMGYGKQGMTFLPCGNYFAVEAKQYYYSGPVYVLVKQEGWEDSIEISLKSFYQLQKFSRFAS